MTSDDPLAAGFVHETLGQRVAFGSGTGTARLREELSALGAVHPMVISDRGEQAARLIEGLAVVSVWSDVVQHVPADLAARAVGAARTEGADALVAIGGGSAIGLAKAVALELALPIIAVPTTFAGSEATDVWGRTADGTKTTGVDRRVLPVAVVYDANLVVSLPPSLAMASAMNAIAHCVDSLWAPRADPINATTAAEALGALVDGVRRLSAHPGDGPAFQRLQYGAYLAAVAFASAGSGLHHKICHVLGGAFDLPHADLHAVVLPYVLAYNIDAAPAAAHRLGRTLDAADPLDALLRVRTAAGTPTSLRQLGMDGSALPAAVEQTLPAVPASNPRPVDTQSLFRLLSAAWAGEPPSQLRKPG